MSIVSKPSSAIVEALAVVNETGGRDRLLSLVYHELVRIARNELNRHRRGQTLNTRALVNEAYVKLFGHTTLAFENSSHFYAAAACAMRQVIIDYARARKAERRGGGVDHLVLDSIEDQQEQIDLQVDQLLALDRALEKLATLDERLVKIVELRFFAGLGITEIATLLGVSEPTVKRDTRAAKAFMHRELSGLAD
jgi:RNA polymerase sigma factor (TIGR02999 family)